MKIAVIGSRSLDVTELEKYLPDDVSEIVSGGAKGVDTAAGLYAKKHGIPLTEFFPDYDTYGRSAPIRRNLEIIAYADQVMAFWDGRSRGTRFVIDRCLKSGKPIRIFLAADKPKEV